MRIVLIDDHALFREGVRALLKPFGDVEVVGEAESAGEGLEVVAAERPDVIVLDLALPDRSGISAIPELLAAAPGAHLLVLSMYDTSEYVAQALAAGAHGYAVKSQGIEELRDALRAVATGVRYLAPGLPRSLLEARKQGALAALTPREREIFELAARGRSNEEIAHDLGISVKTAETHRAKINRKLGIHSVAELVRYAARHGLRF